MSTPNTKTAASKKSKSSFSEEEAVYLHMLGWKVIDSGISEDPLSKEVLNYETYRSPRRSGHIVHWWPKVVEWEDHRHKGGPYGAVKDVDNAAWFYTMTEAIAYAEEHFDRR